MDIKDSYLHGTVGVVKSISVTADKLTYKLADVANTSVNVTLPLATTSANGLLSSADKTKLDNLSTTFGNYVTIDTDQQVTGIKTFTKQQKFTVAQGTAPFAVTSTTKVVNLNADYLDGISSDGFIRYDSNIDSSTTTSATAHIGYAYNTKGWNTSGPAISIGASNGYIMQMQQLGGGHNIYVRYGNPDGFGDWKQLAFTDSNIKGNAATATKLATKRKLWGQDFDGSADVSGSLSNVTSITSKSSDHLILRTPAESGKYVYLRFNSNDNTSVCLTGNGFMPTSASSNKLTLGASGNKWSTVYATTFIGNLDGTYVNKLTGYSKATSASDIAATDTLNTALGKLEYKAHYAYDWIIGVTATDTDEYINKWGEIVGFLDSVKEGSDILDEFVTRKTAQTITGVKTFSGGITLSCGLNINSTNPITWNDGSYHQRIQTTDDSTTNTAVFTFQQSSDTGSTWTDLFTIKDNGQVIASKFITSGGTSSQFVKGDGSLDSNKYLINTNTTHTSAYYRTTNVNGTNYAFWSHVNTAAFTIYAPTTAGTQGQVLTSNGSGAPVWSNQNNIAAGSATYLSITQINNESEINTTGIRGYSGSGTNWTGMETMGYSAILSVGNASRGFRLWSGRGETGCLNYCIGNQNGNDWVSARKILDSNNYTTWINTTNFPGLDKTGTVTSIKVGSTSYSPSSGVVSLPAYPTSLKSPNAIKFKNTAGTEVSYDGSAAVDLTSGVSYATESYKLKPESSSSVNSCYEDQKLRYFTLSGCDSTVSTDGKRYAGYADSYGFPVSNNANALLWVGSHSGNYGHQLGFSSDGRIYNRYISAGSFATTVNGGSWKKIAWTSEIPTKVSQLENDSGFLTSRGYIGTTAVQASSASQNLTGIGNLTMSGNLTITPGNTDNFITFSYSSGTTYSWRLGYLGSGSGDANYLVIQSAKAAGTSWNNVIRMGNETLDAAFGGNVYPITTNTQTLGTTDYQWSHIYGVKSTYTGDLTLYTASGDSPAIVFHRGNLGSDTTVDWRMYVTAGHLKLQNAQSGFNSGAWSDVLHFEANQATALLKSTYSITPSTNNTRTLGTSSLKWSNVYATTFTGNLTGNVTGNVSGSSGSCTGNAATATTLKTTTVVSAKAFSLINTTWTDTGYTFANLATGTYAVQVTSGTNLVASGIMSVYKNLSDTAGDEIPLHVYGTAGWRPYLRTHANKLQISSNDASATSRTVTIKIAQIL